MIRDATALELCGGLVLPLLQSLWRQQKWPELCSYLVGVTDALNIALSMHRGDPPLSLGRLLFEVESIRAAAKARRDGTPQPACPEIQLLHLGD